MLREEESWKDRREKKEENEGKEKTKGRKNVEIFSNLKIFGQKNKRQFMKLVKNYFFVKERNMPNHIVASSPFGN
jgi:hypothetical protein